MLAVKLVSQRGTWMLGNLVDLVVSPVDSDNNPATVMRMGDGNKFQGFWSGCSTCRRFWPAWNRFEFEWIWGDWSSDFDMLQPKTIDLDNPRLGLQVLPSTQWPLVSKSSCAAPSSALLCLLLWCLLRCLLPVPSTLLDRGLGGILPRWCGFSMAFTHWRYMLVPVVCMLALMLLQISVFWSGKLPGVLTSFVYISTRHRSRGLGFWDFFDFRVLSEVRAPKF